MPVTSADLWKLLKQSHLLSAERLEQVRSAFALAGNSPDQVPAQALAQWLLQRQMLTRYQAKVLLKGRAGPFFYGDYQIQDRIRGGRLAKTFLAVHVPSRFGVQLKFASSRIAQDPRQWSTARRYIHTASLIVQDQLQRVFALEDQAGYRFLVVERLDGTSLVEHLAGQKCLSPSEACRIGRLAAIGLAALHDQHQIHGDIRPANLWLENGGNIKVLRDSPRPPVLPALWQSGLHSTQIVQADYLAPELAHPGMSLSSATDIYALGCTLYELLQGAPPYSSGHPPRDQNTRDQNTRDRNTGNLSADKLNTAELNRHSAALVPPINAQTVPADLTGTVELLLSKEPVERPEALEVAEYLLPFIEPAAQTIVEIAPSATLLAYESALKNPSEANVPAPPPVISAPDDHPVLPEPPVQVTSSPLQQSQTTEVEESQELSRFESAASAVAVVSQPRRSSPARRQRRKRQSRQKQAITLSTVAAILLVIAGGVIVLNPRIRESLFGRRSVAKVDRRDSSTKASKNKTGTVGRGGSADPSAAASQDGYQLRNDDGKTLWMTPTTGSPLELQLLAPGAQVVAVVRPADIATSTEGKKTLAAFGPSLAAAQQKWETQVGLTFDQLAQVTISLHATDSNPSISIITQLKEPQTLEKLLANWGNPTAKSAGKDQYYVTDEWAFFVPEQDSLTRFVMAPESLVQEVIEGQGMPPILRREMARLLQNSDRDRHATVVFATDFLVEDLSATKTQFQVRLRETLHWLLNVDVKACLVSMQYGETFFLEMRAYGLAGTDSLALADSLRGRIGEVPDRIESVFEKIYPAVYWRRVALRFPEMIRFLYRYTRVGVEHDQAIVNAVLPGQAAHNLVFGAEMLLSTGNELVASSDDVAETTPALVPQSIDELIETSLDLSFDQKSLEFAIAGLASDIRETYPKLQFPFDIQILGADLQLNGITRNQQISEFTVRDQTIAEILTAIVMRANSETSVTDPSEIDQKLIWVVGPAPRDPKEQILLITTRDAAQREGYKLPEPFQPK